MESQPIPTCVLPPVLFRAICAKVPLHPEASATYAIFLPTAPEPVGRARAAPELQGEDGVDASCRLAGTDFDGTNKKTARLDAFRAPWTG